MVNVTPRMFYPGERSTATVEVEDGGGWPRASLEVFRDEEIYERDSNSSSSSTEHSSYTDSATAAPQ